VLAYVAGQSVALDPADVNAAKRRAITVVAAGGDVHRELTVDDVAVKRLALELYADERRAELARAIDDLAVRARSLPHVREAVLFLAADVDLAWRLFALGLVVEDLAE
jgi:hypothetical protein